MKFRSFRIMALGALCFGLAANSAYAQAKKSQAADEVEETVTAKDGFPVAFTYYKPAGANENTASVILLHKIGSNRLSYAPFAKFLQSQQFAVFSVDLRKHGESKPSGGAAGGSKTKRKRGTSRVTLKKQDYERIIALDMEALKKFMVEEHQKKKLNIRKTAIVAAQESAPIAINFALRDWLKKAHDDNAIAAYRTPRGQDIRALVLLSPEDSVPGISTGKAIGALRFPVRQVAVFVAYGTEDSYDKGQSKKMFDKFSSIKGNEERMELHGYPFKSRGTDLFRLGRRVKLIPQVLGFLKKHVQSKPDKWRDRRSRLET